jgi:small GTP-binding protein
VPKSYKLKLVIGGASGSGKTSFLHGMPINDTPIGVSFKTIECFINEGDSYKFMIWDLKARERFRFMYPSFCRGACGAILCYDLTDPKSLEALNDWINLIKKHVGDIPIVLVGTKKDLNSNAIDQDDLKFFLKKNKVISNYEISIHDENIKDIKGAIFQKIIENIHPEVEITDFSILFPMQDKDFVEFAEMFLMCPICYKENHIDSLVKFFYSKAPNDVLLRDNLLTLVEDLHKFQNLYLGIPCCKCYRKIFESSEDA